MDRSRRPPMGDDAPTCRGRYAENAALQAVHTSGRRKVIREEAARKLARQLLEKRISRMTSLSDNFIDVMARVIMTYVEMDEQQQRNERQSDAAKESK